MKLLVTGSEGSLMQRTIPLFAQEHGIIGVDNMARYGHVHRERGYDFVCGDLADAEFCDDVVRGVDGVVQAAAQIYGVGGFHACGADILADDVALHRNILKAMVRRGVGEMVYISSSMVYERCQVHPSREEDADDACIPATEYGLSKLVGERLTKAFARQYGISYSIWRPFNIITPHEKAEGEQGISHVFADFIKHIVIDKADVLPIIGDGEQVRCFTWIDDVASGIARHSFTAAAKDDTFNLGNPQPTTMKELARLIHFTAQELGLIPTTRKPLQFVSRQSFADDVRVRIPHVGKAEAALGWTPSCSVEESVRRCLRELA